MESSLLKINDKFNIIGFIRSLIFFGIYYLYILLYINPLLYYQNQRPVFLIDERFFNQFFSYPGGLIEYLSAFISQFYIFPWIGALFIVGIIWLITLCTSTIIKSISEKKESQILQFIPALILLSLHSSYDYLLAISLGLLIALVFIYLYIKFSPENKLVRILLFLFYTIIVFHFTAGPMALFISISFLHELIKKHQIVISISYIIIGSVIFYIAPNFFLIPPRDVFLNLISFAGNQEMTYLQYILFMYFPILYILLVYGTKSLNSLSKKNKLANTAVSFFNKKQLVPYQTLILVLLIPAILYFSFNKENKALLQIERYAQTGEWRKVLDLAKTRTNDNILIAFQANRAMYHLGILADSMFTLPQKWAEDGLILPKELSSMYPLQRSDLFFEIGHINEAEHLAFEALSLNENFPWTIQRLAQIHILNQNEQAARNCLLLLDKTLFYKDWTMKHRNYVGNNQALLADAKLVNIKSCIPHTDFLIDPDNQFIDVKSLLEQQVQNKMAFEYLMAYYLFNAELGKFINNISKLNTLGYKKFPRHYEEAMLLYKSQGGGKKFRIQNDTFNPNTVARFRNVHGILKKYSGNKRAAHKELQKKHGDTYWYYVLYNKKQ